MVEFTGERIIPGKVDDDLLNEHLSRYAFATSLATGRRCLDAGCGVGYGTALLGKHAISAVGVDLDVETTVTAHQLHAQPHVRFCTADVTALPFPPASFDLCISFEVVEHLVAWPQFLR